jgi:hypothetical protein
MFRRILVACDGSRMYLRSFRSRVLAFEVGGRHVHGVVTKRRIRMDSLTQPEPASGRLTIQEPSRPATSVAATFSQRKGLFLDLVSSGRVANSHLP